MQWFMKAASRPDIEHALCLFERCRVQLNKINAEKICHDQLPRFVLSLIQMSNRTNPTQCELQPLLAVEQLALRQHFTERQLSTFMASTTPMSADAQIFAFEAMKAAHHTAADRHKQGVHYTPIKVVDALLSATLPALENASDILSLRICDPAMGCGIFLLRAAEMLSAALLDVLPAQTDDQRLAPILQVETPALRLAWAKRMVTQHCLFGADIDAETVRSARLVLAHACEVPGQTPLNLNTNLVTGDALVGLTPASALAGAWTAFKHDTLQGRHNLSCAEQQVLATEFVRERLSLAHKVEFRPVHWSMRFPQIFADSNDGFDVVVGNPPFGNAINAGTGTGAYYRDWWKQTAPDLAQGAFDRANCFVDLSRRLLRTHGRYGLVLPRSLLSGGRANTALQTSLNQTAAPTDIYVFNDPKLFDGANVFTCGLAGTKNAQPSFVKVHHNLSQHAIEVPFDDAVPWWTLTTRTPAAGTTDVPHGFESLSAHHSIRAGCATDTAYQLANAVHDAEYGEGLKLITTGLIDRYMQGWGLGTVRFLKRRFGFPRWPTCHEANTTIDKQIMRQSKPKILLGGLTKTLEAYLDQTGECGGVVSTWIVQPDTLQSHAYMQRLEAVLNSWIVSWHYHQAYGAQQSPWGGMTIKKNGLAKIAVPSELLSLETINKMDHTDPWALCPEADQNVLMACIAVQVNELNTARTQHNFGRMYTIDSNLQPYFARLYGCTQRQFDHIAGWFQSRDRSRRPMQTYGSPTALDLNSALNPRIHEADSDTTGRRH